MNYAHFKHYLGEVLQVIEQAARAGYRQIVGPLVSRWNPETVFIEAARTGFEATVQAMLEKDQPNLWNVPRHLGESRPGHGALSAAVENGHKGVARIILEASRIGINATGDERTPLHLAVLRKQTAMAELLTNFGGTNVKMRDADGKPPIQLAAKGGDEDIYQLVLSASREGPRLQRGSRGVRSGGVWR